MDPELDSSPSDVSDLLYQHYVYEAEEEDLSSFVFSFILCMNSDLFTFIFILLRIWIIYHFMSLLALLSMIGLLCIFNDCIIIVISMIYACVSSMIVNSA